MAPHARAEAPHVQGSCVRTAGQSGADTHTQIPVPIKPTLGCRAPSHLYSLLPTHLGTLAPACLFPAPRHPHTCMPYYLHPIANTPHCHIPGQQHLLIYLDILTPYTLVHQPIYPHLPPIPPIHSGCMHTFPRTSTHLQAWAPTYLVLAHLQIHTPPLTPRHPGTSRSL